MLDGLWSFANRHRRKLVIGAGVVGGLYYSGKLLTQRLMEMQGASSKQRIAKENIRRRFDQNQRDCLFTIMSLLPELSEQVLHEVDVERLIAELRAINKPLPSDSADKQEAAEDQGEPSKLNDSESPEQTVNGTPARARDTPKRTKVEIWEDIKVQSFARTMIAVYAESLLAILVHVQLNMVGRGTYLDSVIGKYTEGANGKVALEGRYVSQLSLADEQNFLMLSWWFLNRGWRRLMTQMLNATNQCVGQLSLKERLTHRELASLFNDIHVRLRENGLVEMLPEMLLPLGDENTAEYLASNRLSASQVFTPMFERLLDQLRDVIESSDFIYVFNSCVDRLTMQLLDVLRESFPESVPAPAPARPLPPTVEGEAAPSLDDVVKEFEEFATPESRVVVVQLLPRIAREGHQILNGVPNQYLENVSASREVQALSAAVYTAKDA
ncbi:peroxin [Coemansia sp. RSA 1290]|nr:Peroxin-3 [Coemansia mojavensis]KAJ1743511.1 peroxin [Coemansia sp. RSA 1086]KAJ1753798.1 peroxin [Coemansia sp. RSA 1821]KAJ2632883.1 peroxin [Coemansia sp. RSA 1290]KAJ2653777.1 peroxin [Coemansia sp. RSA 1250]